MAKLTRDELLVLLIEECGEVIQAATKCLRFGYDVDHDIGYGRNSDVLASECGDLQAVMDELPLNTAAKEQSQYGKIAKAERAKAKFGVRAALSQAKGGEND
jgi:hypothetical protein